MSDVVRGALTRWRRLVSAPLIALLAILAVTGCAESDPAESSLPEVLVIDNGIAQWPEDLGDAATITRDSDPNRSWMSTGPSSVADAVTSAEISPDMVVIQLTVPPGGAPDEVIASALLSGANAVEASGAIPVVVLSGPTVQWHALATDIARQRGVLLISTSTEGNPASDREAAEHMRNLLKAFAD